MESSQPKPAQNHPISPQEQEKSSIEDDPSSTFTCEICVEPVLVSQSAMKFNNNKNCIHPFCTDCMGKYIQVKLEDNVAKIKCPALDCGQFLDPLSCRPLIARQLFDKWCDVLCNSTVLSMNGVYCPSRDCSALVVNECGGNVERTICPNCKKAYCFRCRVPWHTGFRCEDSVEIRDRNDVAFGVLAEAKKWKRCPRCRHFVERAQGCAIVNCRCGTNFCYKCGNHVHLCDCLISHRNSLELPFPLESPSWEDLDQSYESYKSYLKVAGPCNGIVAISIGSDQLVLWKYHWSLFGLTYDEDERIRIGWFDLGAEVFGVIEWPNNLRFTYLWISVFKECLALVIKRESSVMDRKMYQIWIMEDGGLSWTNYATVGPFPWREMAIGFWKEELILDNRYEGYQVYSYNIKTHVKKKMIQGVIFDTRMLPLTIYNENLVSVLGKG